LLAVEDTFKTTKALLTTRPIFHKTDAAIRGHIFCSFLAVLLRKELFDRLAARRHGDLEWQHIVDDLDELSEVAVEQDGRRALLRTAPGATIDPLCRALGITLPPVFQEIPPAPKPARSCGARQSSRGSPFGVRGEDVIFCRYCRMARVHYHADANWHRPSCQNT
jgi:hypothetical protein